MATNAPASDTPTRGQHNDYTRDQKRRLLDLIQEGEEAILRIVADNKARFEEVRKLIGDYTAGEEERKPSVGAVTYDQSFLNMMQLPRKIRNLMTTDSWIIFIPRHLREPVLRQLFLECRKEVRELYDNIKSVLETTSVGNDGKHMRDHHKKLFHLMDGEKLKQTLARIIHRVDDKLSHAYNIFRNQEDYKNWTLKDSDLGDQVLEYFEIMVNAHLQDSSVSFLSLCAGVQPFDRDIHHDVAASGIQEGDSCVVVFPALLDGQKPCTQSFVVSSNAPTLKLQGGLSTDEVTFSSQAGGSNPSAPIQSFTPGQTLPAFSAATDGQLSQSQPQGYARRKGSRLFCCFRDRPKHQGERDAATGEGPHEVPPEQIIDQQMQAEHPDNNRKPGQRTPAGTT